MSDPRPRSDAIVHRLRDQGARILKRGLLSAGILALPPVRRRLNPLGYSYKRILLGEIAVKCGCDVFVETGTSSGDTARYMAQIARKVLTCEPDPELYERFTKSGGHGNITIWNRASEDCFAEMLARIDGKPLFWLDGHYSGAGTARTRDHTPIVEELRLIAANDVQGAIAIDDMRLFGSPQNRLANTYEPGYPELNAVLALLEGAIRENTLAIVGDCLLSTPVEIRFR